ncbi:hypothetical protein BGZ73_003740 [Actinomortierella ambigua]|nr:hypothetical protein BGZ73_003740 [Actinomortierella ambigua]
MTRALPLDSSEQYDLAVGDAANRCRYPHQHSRSASCVLPVLHKAPSAQSHQPYLPTSAPGTACGTNSLSELTTHSVEEKAKDAEVMRLDDDQNWREMSPIDRCDSSDRNISIGNSYLSPQSLATTATEGGTTAKETLNTSICSEHGLARPPTTAVALSPVASKSTPPAILTRASRFIRRLSQDRHNQLSPIMEPEEREQHGEPDSAFALRDPQALPLSDSVSNDYKSAGGDTPPLSPLSVPTPPLRPPAPDPLAERQSGSDGMTAASSQNGISQFWHTNRHQHYRHMHQAALRLDSFQRSKSLHVDHKEAMLRISPFQQHPHWSLSTSGLADRSSTATFESANTKSPAVAAVSGEDVMAESRCVATGIPRCPSLKFDKTIPQEYFGVSTSGGLVSGNDVDSRGPNGPAMAITVATPTPTRGASRIQQVLATLRCEEPSTSGRPIGVSSPSNMGGVSSLSPPSACPYPLSALPLPQSTDSHAKQERETDQAVDLQLAPTVASHPVQKCQKQTTVSVFDDNVADVDGGNGGVEGGDKRGEGAEAAGGQCPQLVAPDHSVQTDPSSSAPPSSSTTCCAHGSELCKETLVMGADEKEEKDVLQDTERAARKEERQRRGRPFWATAHLFSRNTGSGNDAVVAAAVLAATLRAQQDTAGMAEDDITLQETEHDLLPEESVLQEYTTK